jgi:hypothetical protein
VDNCPIPVDKTPLMWINWKIFSINCGENCGFWQERVDRPLFRGISTDYPQMKLDKIFSQTGISG